MDCYEGNGISKENRVAKHYIVNNNLQSEQTAEQQTSLVLAKECDRDVLCHPSYLHREHNERSGRRTEQQ